MNYTILMHLSPIIPNHKRRERREERGERREQIGGERGERGEREEGGMALMDSVARGHSFELNLTARWNEQIIVPSGMR